MVVVVHKAVGVTDPVIAFVDVMKCSEEILAVLVVLVHGFLFIAAGRYVIHGARVLNAKGTSHGPTIAKSGCNVK